MITTKDLGKLDYGDALKIQQDIFNKAVAAKRAGQSVDERLILVEHDPVYTLGRHADRNNILFNPDILASEGIRVFAINRGGDVTYHGPGQLVAYPIIDLQRHNLGVKAYVNLLEEAVIRTISKYGITGTRDEGATGVWLGSGHELRKICAIGVAVSRSVTMHGLALNVNTDLGYFTRINPCGFTDRGVTSIARELHREVNFEDVKEIFRQEFIKLLL